jgi:membrane protease YdiL (CAAX protease family)/predicted negative regulator of RcsB-dependent stress response
MTLKRLFLIGLTLFAALLSGLSLVASWQKPQFQSRLELYQTNIVLQAQAWRPETSQDDIYQQIQTAVIGEKPLEAATKQYQEASQSVQSNLDKLTEQLAKLHTTKTPISPLPTKTASQAAEKQLQDSIDELQKWRSELNLNLGILQVQEGETDSALKTWEQLQQQSPKYPEQQQMAEVLSGIWRNPPLLLPKAQQIIQRNLSGWFRSTALIQLYQLQQRQEALSTIQAEQQTAASKALTKLTIIAVIPTLTAIFGIILLVFLVGQRLILKNHSILAQNAEERWLTPWNWEVVLQVFVLGFFLMGQFFIPLLFDILPIPQSTNNVQIETVSILIQYLLISSGALTVLYLSLKRFFPLPESWFRLRFNGSFLLWGIGGYCVALPIVVIVSLVNQQLWQGQGGSNPLLQLALESQDTLALAIFFITAVICAPFFEELLFRGFLLPSLTRYLPVWGAIGASSLLFAIAHLSLSEVLPLTALGSVLGVVYTRSRNLLAPMLIHAMWNSGTLMSLFLLGSNN